MFFSLQKEADPNALDMWCPKAGCVLTAAFDFTLSIQPEAAQPPSQQGKTVAKAREGHSPQISGERENVFLQALLPTLPRRILLLTVKFLWHCPDQMKFFSSEPVHTTPYTTSLRRNVLEPNNVATHYVVLHVVSSYQCTHFPISRADQDLSWQYLAGLLFKT